MPEENQNPNEANTFSVPETPAPQAPPATTPVNPLNTGNGVPNSQAPITEEVSAVQAPAGNAPQQIDVTPQAPGTPTETPAPEMNQAQIDQQLENQLTEATSGETIEKPKKPIVKYIIIAAVIIAVIIGGYFLYKTFFNSSPIIEPPVEETTETNTLGSEEVTEDTETLEDEEIEESEDAEAPSEELEKLETLIDELGEIVEDGVELEGAEEGIDFGNPPALELPTPPEATAIPEETKVAR